MRRIDPSQEVAHFSSTAFGYNRGGVAHTRACVMAVRFVTVDREPPDILPATVQEYLPGDHLARLRSSCHPNPRLNPQPDHFSLTKSGLEALTTQGAPAVEQTRIKAARADIGAGQARHCQSGPHQDQRQRQQAQGGVEVISSTSLCAESAPNIGRY